MILMMDQIHAMPNSDTINTADTMTVTVLSLTSVISTQGTQRTPVAWVIPPSVVLLRYCPVSIDRYTGLTAL